MEGSEWVRCSINIVKYLTLYQRLCSLQLLGVICGQDIGRICEQAPLVSASTLQVT